MNIIILQPFFFTPWTFKHPYPLLTLEILLAIKSSRKFLFLNETFLGIMLTMFWSLSVSKDGAMTGVAVKPGKLWRQCHISGFVSLNQLRKKDNQSFSLESQNSDYFSDIQKQNILQFTACNIINWNLVSQWKSLNIYEKLCNKKTSQTITVVWNCPQDK